MNADKPSAAKPQPKREVARRGGAETRRKAIFTAETPRRRGKPKRTAPLRWNAARLPCGLEGHEKNRFSGKSTRRASNVALAAQISAEKRKAIFTAETPRKTKKNGPVE